MRALVLVGRLSLGRRVVARQCGWCRTWFRVRDHVLASLGAKVSHGICPSCAAKHFPEDAA